MSNIRQIIAFIFILLGITLYAKTSISRVTPIIYNGYRYEATPDGYVVKYNVVTGNVEWRRQIYVNIYETSLGLSKCVQTCQITRMELSKGVLTVINQKGYVYVLNLTDLSVKVVSGSIMVDNVRLGKIEPGSLCR
jgi:hypothetical protein